MIKRAVDLCAHVSSNIVLNIKSSALAASIFHIDADALLPETKHFCSALCLWIYIYVCVCSMRTSVSLSVCSVNYKLKICCIKSQERISSIESIIWSWWMCREQHSEFLFDAS